MEKRTGSTVYTKNAKETEKLGEEFSKNLKGGETISLVGDLGGGKTTFVKGLARGLRVSGEITSPTFIILNLLRGKSGKFLCHVDLYRLEQITDLREVGLEECINDKNTITVIEWGERIKKYLPQDTITIEFDFIDKNTRGVLISGKQ